jgi:hypothetical protein
MGAGRATFYPTHFLLAMLQPSANPVMIDHKICAGTLQSRTGGKRRVMRRLCRITCNVKRKMHLEMISLNSPSKEITASFSKMNSNIWNICNDTKQMGECSNRTQLFPPLRGTRHRLAKMASTFHITSTTPHE